MDTPGACATWVVSGWEGILLRHSDCFKVGMITGCCIFFALLAAGFFTEMIAATSAPLGYQDEAGFHFGFPTPIQTAAWELENPS